MGRGDAHPDAPRPSARPARHGGVRQRGGGGGASRAPSSSPAPRALGRGQRRGGGRGAGTGQPPAFWHGGRSHAGCVALSPLHRTWPSKCGGGSVACPALGPLARTAMDIYIWYCNMSICHDLAVLEAALQKYAVANS